MNGVMSYQDGAPAALREGPNSEKQSAPSPPLARDETARSLTLLAEGAALATPEIDAQAYAEFRANVSKLAVRLPDRLPEDEKLALVRPILKEFDHYRKTAEEELRNRSNEWRGATELLLRDLLKSLGINEGASSASQLLKRIGGASSSREVAGLREALDRFLHPTGADSAPAEASQFRKADHSTENDNAAGLRGGGSAVERLRDIMARGGRGFIAKFELGSLEMISQRFGLETVHDCLMEVSAYLTHSLHSDDSIYHWSDSSLIAILQGRTNEKILSAELQRIASHNRDITVNVDGRNIMVRIPLWFDLTPIDSLRSADELCKLQVKHATNR